MIAFLSSAIVPIFIITILFAGLVKKIPVYDVFCSGAKEGLNIVVKITPMIIGLMMAVTVFRESGALQIFGNLIKPITELLKIPEELVPIALLRPLSGGASTAILMDTLQNYGPDSFIGKAVSTIAGATETTFYVITIYYGSVNIKNIKNTLWISLIVDFIGIILSVYIWKLWT